MLESSFNVSAARDDNNSPDERLETGAYLLREKKSDGTVKRSVRVSIDPDDETKIGVTESSISKEIGSTLAILKPTKSSIARESWTEQRTTGNFIGEITDMEEECHFVTGSSYKGSWDALGMAGVGRYVMPHGAAYEGEIRDGMFHGHGSLYWSKNKRLDVVHLRGKLQEHRYTFEDGLLYEDTDDWSYCMFPDRRFNEEVKKGLRPAGRTLKTSKQPTKVLPSGCYDTGDGVFDPKTLRITSHDDTKKVLRVPKKEEYDWIINNCRKSWTEPTGYRPELNENWSENPPDLPYHIALSENSPDSWWKRLTTFKRHSDNAETEVKDIYSRLPEEELSVPEVCLCGQYVIFGEPCCCTNIPALFDSDSIMEEDYCAPQSISNSSDYINKKSFSRAEGSSRGVSEIFKVDIDNSSDCAAASIQREKVTEPETSNGRGMESERSKLLPKGNTTERDLPFDRTDEQPIRSAVIVAPMIQKIQQENTTHRSVSNGLAVNNLTASTSGKKIFEDNLEATKSGRLRDDSDSSNSKKYPSTEKLSLRTSENLLINEQFSKMSKESSPIRNLEELQIETVEKIVSLNAKDLGATASNTSNLDEEIAIKKSSIISNDLRILEKLHNSLAALPYKEQESIDEKEIIEIYSKFSKRGNLRTKCPNTNVWRLTGAAQDDASQNKVEDLFHPALTASRSELIEYMTKPCCVKVCKPPTLPEVRTSESLCRKEFPFNVPTTKRRFSVERCKNFKN